MENSTLQVSKYLQAILVGTIIYSVFYFLARYDYLLFHTAVEIYSAVIVLSIFVIVWNARKMLANNYLYIIGVSFLFLGIVTVLHALAYKGMNVFKGFDANLATQLWLIGRILQAGTLSFAPFFFRKNISPAYTFGVYIIIFILTILSVFYFKVFPSAYVEGSGLTTFKIVTEYIIMFVLGLNILLLYRNYHERLQLERSVMKILISSMGIGILAGLMFTIYTGVYDGFNFIGHLLLLLEFYLIYKAIIVTSLTKPYNTLFHDLKLSEENLKKEQEKVKLYLNMAQVIFLVIDKDHIVRMINKKGCELFGYSEEEMLGKNWFDHFVPKDIKEHHRKLCTEIMNKKEDALEYYENTILTAKGEVKLIAWNNTFIRNEAGEKTAIISAGEDITYIKEFAKEKERLERLYYESKAANEAKAVNALVN